MGRGPVQTGAASTISTSAVQESVRSFCAVAIAINPPRPDPLCAAIATAYISAIPTYGVPLVILAIGIPIALCARRLLSVGGLLSAVA